jgi:archaellum biogenesis ATPase FlaH
MGIPVTITGLKELISEIPEGNLILAVSSTSPVNTIFVQKISVQAVKYGNPVTYITSRTAQEVHEQIVYYQNESAHGLRVVEERSPMRWKDYIEKQSLLVIDSFSYLVLDMTLTEVRVILEEFLHDCQDRNAVVLLTMEEGMLDRRTEISTAYLADGIFQFLNKETSKGVAHFIRIPKWMKAQSFNDNINYTFEDKSIKVDLRSRVS